MTGDSDRTTKCRCIEPLSGRRHTPEVRRSNNSALYVHVKQVASSVEAGGKLLCVNIRLRSIVSPAGNSSPEKCLTLVRMTLSPGQAG